MKKSSDWFVGEDHDELLDKAFSRRQKRDFKDQSSNVRATVPIQKSRQDGSIFTDGSEFYRTDQAQSVMITFMVNNFESLFDCFRELDTRRVGRLSGQEFREGLRKLSVKLKSIPSTSYDSVFSSVDTDGDGLITLEEFVRYFDARVARLIPAVKSERMAMTTATGLRLETARKDTVSGFRSTRGTVRFDEKIEGPFRRTGAMTNPRFRMFETKRADPEVDFGAKHRWIDSVMKDLALTEGQEPIDMQLKWEKVKNECQLVDRTDTKKISIEGFRNSLTRAEPRLSPDQIEWFVKEADKDETGDILYDFFVNKRLKVSIRSGETEILFAEAKVRASIRIHYKSTKEAFKAFDIDRDGRLNRDEFSHMLVKQNLSLARGTVELMFRRADSNLDGFVEYHDFLHRFQTQPPGPQGQQFSNDDISRAFLQCFGNVAALFRALDRDSDGLVTCVDIYEVGNESKVVLGGLSVDRALEYVSVLDREGQGLLDWRDLLRHFSRFQPEPSLGVDGGWAARMRERLREKFDDARQVFHAFDVRRAGRLSLQDFMAGIERLVLRPPESLAEHGAQLRQLFDGADCDGDGLLDYHAFLAAFPVQPKRFASASAAERDLRELLRERFSSATEAFKALDVDGDLRLSRTDMQQALRGLGREVTERELDVMVRRSDRDGDGALDYGEFVLRFGLEQRAAGRWVFKVDEPPPPSEGEARRARLFRNHMRASKWWGRGGVVGALRRFDTNGDGRLDTREVAEALRDDRCGLGMVGMTDEDIVDLLGGPPMDRPYCHGGSKSLDIDLFGRLFVEGHFGRERAWFHLLLVRNKWPDLLDACRAAAMACADQDGPGRLVSKAELALGLDRLVERGTLRKEDRAAVLDWCTTEGLYLGDGPQAGCLDFQKDLLERCIGPEMAIHARVFPVWQAMHARMARVGAELSYSQFEELCHEFAWQDGEGLTDEQVSWLIDVMDCNCDGLVSCDEFLRRYARDEHPFAVALQATWHPVASMLHRAASGGGPDYALPAGLVESVLVKAAGEGLLGSLDAAQVAGLVRGVSGHLLADGGRVRALAWVLGYAGPRYAVHRAIEGPPFGDGPGVLLWDALIGHLEQLHASRVLPPPGSPVSATHPVSREQLRRLLDKVGARFASVSGGEDEGRELVEKLVGDLDPGLTGWLDWMDLVQARGPAALYYFSARQALSARCLVRQRWRELLQWCAQAEGSCPRRGVPCVVEASGPAPPRSHRLPWWALAALADCEDLRGTLSLPRFAACVGKLEACSDASTRKGDDSGEAGRPASPATIAALLQLAQHRFGALATESRDGEDGEVEVDYWGLLEHYAGEVMGADLQVAVRNDAVLVALSSAQQTLGNGPVPLVELVAVLQRPGLGLGDALVALVASWPTSAPAGMTCVPDLVWRCARGPVTAALRRCWLLLYALWSDADADGAGSLPVAEVCRALRRGEVGLSCLQVQAAAERLELLADGQVDYCALLAGGGLRGQPARACPGFLAWRALEHDTGSAALARLLAESASGARAATAGASHTPARGFWVPLPLLRTLLLQEARRGGPAGPLHGLSLEGLDECLAALRGNKLTGQGSTGAGGDGEVELDRATWMLWAGRMRGALLRTEGGALAGRVVGRVRAELESQWDRNAGPEGRDGYSPMGGDAVGTRGGWGLGMDLAEQSVAQALAGQVWANRLHAGALARRAARLGRASGEGGLVTEEAMRQALASLAAPHLFLLLHRPPPAGLEATSQSQPWEQGLRALGDRCEEEWGEAGGGEIAAALGDLAAAATGHHDVWLQDPRAACLAPDAARPHMRHAPRAYAGCLISPPPPPPPPATGPPPLQRGHLRRALLATSPAGQDSSDRLRAAAAARARSYLHASPAWCALWGPALSSPSPAPPPEDRPEQAGAGGDWEGRDLRGLAEVRRRQGVYARLRQLCSARPAPPHSLLKDPQPEWARPIPVAPSPAAQAPHFRNASQEAWQVPHQVAQASGVRGPPEGTESMAGGGAYGWRAGRTSSEGGADRAADESLLPLYQDTLRQLHELLHA